LAEIVSDSIINNKIHSVTKMSPFMVNYRRELKIEVDIRRKKI